MKTLFKFILFHIAAICLVILLADKSTTARKKIADSEKEKLEANIRK